MISITDNEREPSQSSERQVPLMKLFQSTGAIKYKVRSRIFFLGGKA